MDEATAKEARSEGEWLAKHSSSEKYFQISLQATK